MEENDDKPSPNIVAEAIKKVAGVFESSDGLLPKILLGPAGTAISRLIGNGADIPAAWLDQYAQRIKDKTAARSEVTQALATQTAKTAVTEPESIERAKAAFVDQVYRRQANKDAVVMKTIENLQADPAPEHSDGPSEDWLAKFERHAEDASSDQLRSLFAKILAGEIRNPGAISLMTLHFISMLDQETATLIQRVFPYTVFTTPDGSAAGTLIECCDPPLRLEQKLDLERCGFCSHASGLTTTFNFDENGNKIIRLKNNLGFVLQGDADDTVRFDTLVLSKAGLDLFNITDSSFKVQKLADVALAKESVKRCYHGPMTVHGETVKVDGITELFASVPPQDP
jgi:hypothetical protein